MSKRIFHKKLYKDQCKQLRLVGFIGLGLLSLIAILIPVGRAISIARDQASGIASLMGRLNVGIIPYHFYLYFVLVLLVPLLALVCFHFLTQRNSSDFYHSLPHTRTCLFTCSIAAIFTWTTILVWVPTLLSAIIYSLLSKYFVIEISILLRFALFIYVGSLLVSVSIALACSLTGTVFTNVVVAGIIIFLPRIFIFALSSMISGSSSLLVGMHLSPLIDPQYNVVFALILSVMEQSMLTWSGLIYTLILTVLYLVIGVLVFKHRKSEASNKAAVSRKVQTVIRLLLGLTVSLIPMSMIFSVITGYEHIEGSDGPLFFYIMVILYLVACLVMLLYELITTRKLKNVVKALPSIGILAISNVLILVGCFGIFKNLQSYSPSADDIDYIIMENNSYTDDLEYYDHSVSSIQINDDASKEIISQSLKKSIDIDKNEHNDFFSEDYTNMTVGIHSGLSTHYRNIYIKTDDYQKVLNACAQSKAYIDAYQALPNLSGNKLSVYYSELSDKELQQLYDTAREEIKTLKFENWYQVLNSVDSANLDVITFYAPIDHTTYKGIIPITGVLPKTCQKYLELSAAKVQSDQSTLLTTLKDIVANGDDAYNGYDIQCSVKNLSTGEQYDSSNSAGDFSKKYIETNSNDANLALLKYITTDAKDTSTFNPASDYVVSVYFYSYDNNTSSVDTTCNFILDRSLIEPLLPNLNTSVYGG